MIIQGRCNKELYFKAGPFVLSIEFFIKVIFHVSKNVFDLFQFQILETIIFHGFYSRCCKHHLHTLQLCQKFQKQINETILPPTIPAIF